MKKLTANDPETKSPDLVAENVAKLKEAVGSLDIEKLKGLADQVLGAIQKQDGVVKSLQEQIGKLAQNPGEIRAKLDAAVAQLGGLKEKLQVVIAKLKEHGIDVSKYLGGN